MIPARRNAALICFASLFFVFPTAQLRAQELARWRLTPEVRFGQDAQRNYEFTRILAVLPASDGSVFIADAGNKQISVFSPTGAFLQTIGRDGRGPGEFELLRSAGLLGDTLWVIDGGERRTSLFARDGKLLSTIRIEIPRSGSARWVDDLTSLLPDGALGSAAPGVQSKMTFTASPVLRMTRAGRTIDTLAWVPSSNQNIWLPLPDGSFIIGRQPFSDATLTVLAPNAPLFFIVDRSVATTPNAATFRVLALRSNGDTLWSRTHAYIPRRLERVRADSFFTVFERYTRRGVTQATIRRALFIPDYYTPVTSAFAASDGSLWLRREDGLSPTVDYWVLGKDGRPTASVTVPANLTLMAASGLKAWGIEKDAYDVSTVVRYSIQR